MKRSLSFLIVLIILSTIHGQAFADTFGSGANLFEIEFVTIGSPGNADDPIGSVGLGGPREGLRVSPGAVDYQYRMGKFEISESMIDKANALGGLEISKDSRGPDKPATNIDWFEAAKFVNWLNTSSDHTPAYKFDASGEFQLWEPEDAGYNSRNLFRNSLARYVLPSVDEWYKAAYYDPVAGVYYDYPTGSITPPIAVASGIDPGTAVFGQDLFSGPADIMNAGGLSPYGTMAQGGNVFEWEETGLDLVNVLKNNPRFRHGGAWDTSNSSLSKHTQAGYFPNIALLNLGFRVASIPEPSTLLFAVLGLFFAVMRLFRQRATE